MVRKLKRYTEPSLLVCDESDMLTLWTNNLQPFYQVEFNTPQPQTLDSVITTTRYTVHRITCLMWNPVLC